MSNVILTPYKLFFIDQDDVLFALMKDGRLCHVKKVDSFSNVSADTKTLMGVSFDGENTHISRTYVDFDKDTSTLASFFGYSYFPTLNMDERKMAFVRADLLCPRPYGLLMIYKKLRKNWKEVFQTKAYIKRPIWSRLSDSLFYINHQNNLVRLKDETQETVCEDVHDFALSPGQTEVLCWDSENLKLVSVIEKKEIARFPASSLNAFCFSADGEAFYLSVTFEGKNNIYMVEKETHKATLLLQYPSAIPFIFVA